MTNCLLGIDVGICGALALYDPVTGELEIADMPLHSLKINNKIKRRIDVYELGRWIDCRKSKIKQAIIEAVSSSPQMGVTSAFQFGFSAGVVEGIIAANFISVKKVTPRVWKRDLNLSQNKDASRKLASELMPRHAGLWPLHKDDGKAESALIAWWAANRTK